MAQEFSRILDTGYPAGVQCTDLILLVCDNATWHRERRTVISGTLQALVGVLELTPLVPPLLCSMQHKRGGDDWNNWGCHRCPLSLNC